MNTAELIVELVLTGLLMLVVLLAPTLAMDDKVRQALTSSDLLAPLIAGGFLLGVVVDRCADSILEGCEARVRCAFAIKEDVWRQRVEIAGGTAIADSFPEDWLRFRLMSHGSDSATKWFEQLRVRIRISRTVLIVVPALATSGLLSLWVAKDKSAYIACLPGLQLLYLLIAVHVAGSKEPPRTCDFLKPEDEKELRKVDLRAVKTWFGLQVLTALAIVVALLVRHFDVDTCVGTVALSAAGAALTVLAVGAWQRITKTFMRFLWDFARFEAPDELRKALIE